MVTETSQELENSGFWPSGKPKTMIRAIVVAWTGRKDKSYGKTKAGQSYLIFHACVYGSKAVPAWWLDLSLWGRAADKANELKLDGRLIKVKGSLWQREVDGRRYTRMQVDDLAVYDREKGQWDSLTSLLGLDQPDDVDGPTPGIEANDVPF